MGVVFEAVGFSEAHDVEPVLSPALAVMRAGQQRSTSFGYASGDLSATNSATSRRRRKSDQIEVKPPDQRTTVGRRGRAEPLFFQPRQDKGINRVLDPVAVRGAVKRGISGWLRLTKAQYWRCAAVNSPSGAVLSSANRYGRTAAPISNRWSSLGVFSAKLLVIIQRMPLHA